MTGRRFLAALSTDNHTLVIDGEEHHHLARVMRARTGMEIEAVNGLGDWFRARILRIGQQRIEAAVLQHEHEQRPPTRLILAPSVLKKRPMDLMLEKLCELGVDEIVPVRFERSDSDCAEQVPDRWQRIALQALKVNRRLWPTRIRAALSLEALIQSSSGIPARVVMEISGQSAPPEEQEPILCVIGPPGDFTPRELAELRGAGFRPWRINDGTLRSETAAIAAAAVFLQRLCRSS